MARVPGKPIAEDVIDGRRVLWVTFEMRCLEERCAYPFTVDDDGKFCLSGLPEREGYDAGKVYRGAMTARARMLRRAHGVFTLSRSYGSEGRVCAELKGIPHPPDDRDYEIQVG